MPTWGELTLHLRVPGFITGRVAPAFLNACGQAGSMPIGESTSVPTKPFFRFSIAANRLSRLPTAGAATPGPDQAGVRIRAPANPNKKLRWHRCKITKQAQSAPFVLVPAFGSRDLHPGGQRFETLVSAQASQTFIHAQKHQPRNAFAIGLLDQIQRFRDVTVIRRCRGLAIL